MLNEIHGNYSFRIKLVCRIQRIVLPLDQEKAQRSDFQGSSIVNFLLWCDICHWLDYYIRRKKYIILTGSK